MHITILTLFPDMFQGPFSLSILKNAQTKGLVTIDIVSLRDFGIGRHQTVDDTPYGGGIGMVMRVDVVAAAIASVRKKSKKEKVILLDARGKTFTQQTAQAYTALDHLILVCGHYEGIDARIEQYVDEVVSIGNFVVTGGEIPAMLLTDATVRLVKGVLKEDATAHESFSLTNEAGEQVVEYPQYTKPETFNSVSVPEVLLSGNHQKIKTWRQQQSKKTL